MLLYPSQTAGVSTYTSPLLLHTSPCNIFSHQCQETPTHNAPACSLLLDVSNFADSRTGLCQQCLGHNVAELEAEKEVDTRVHADAEENDEKRESFEDLPEHLRLGTEFTLRVTVLQVQSTFLTHERLPASKLLILNLHPVLRHSLTDSLID